METPDHTYPMCQARTPASALIPILDEGNGWRLPDRARRCLVHQFSDGRLDALNADDPPNGDGARSRKGARPALPFQVWSRSATRFASSKAARLNHRWNVVPIVHSRPQPTRLSTPHRAPWRCPRPPAMLARSSGPSSEHDLLHRLRFGTNSCTGTEHQQVHEVSHDLVVDGVPRHEEAIPLQPGA